MVDLKLKIQYTVGLMINTYVKSNSISKVQKICYVESQVTETVPTYHQET